jgi:hypothetical protein
MAASHRQIKSFYYGNVWEWLQQNTGKVEYPALFVEHNTSNISTSGRTVTHQLRLYFLDLVNVANETETNENDVLSDMLSVAQDIVFMAKDPAYESPASDDDAWFTSGDVSAVLYTDKTNDSLAGVSIDLPISTLMIPDRCAVPTV